MSTAPNRRKRRPRTDSIANWLRHRKIRASVKDVHILATGFRIRVVSGSSTPHHMGIPQLLDVTGEGTTLAPAIVRVIDPDPGRCLLIMRLDDGLKALQALEERDH